MFFLAEYINMVTVSAVATSLFLGGWLGPFLPVVARMDLVPREGPAAAVLLRVDALDAAAVSLRPADGVRVEVVAAGGGAQPDRDGGAGGLAGLTGLNRDYGAVSASTSSPRLPSSSSLLVVGQHKPMHSVILLIVSFGALRGCTCCSTRHSRR